MRRLARAGLVLLAWPVLTTPVPAPPPPGLGGPATARLFAHAIPLVEDRPGERRLGPLRYLGGWALSSDDMRFGSISAMHVEDGQVIAAGDHGMIFRFPVPDREQLPLALAFPGAGPGAFQSKVDRDSEALQISGGALWLAFENSNEIWRYRRGDLAPTAHAAPRIMHDWGLNRGAETLLRLADGRFLVISEDEDDRGISEAALFFGDPAEPGTPAIPLQIDAPRGHRVTDAAQLPNGALLLLARGFTVTGGWSAKLLVARLPDQAGKPIEAREVATLAAPLSVDNMEALSVTQEQGRTMIWIASDDNLLALQRTLLMKFEWVG
jgi:hypothetical protein